MVLVLAIPIIIILSLYLDLSNASPDFINGLPNDSKESFYTRFFFIFTRYSYLAHEPFGFLFNFNHPIIIEKINNYIKPYDITYLTELNSYKTNMLYLFPKDYISVLTYNYGLFSIPILLSFEIFIIFIIKSFKACYFTKILILNIILLVSVSINLTSISFLMLLPLFFKNKDNHA
ncbi:hypothetical protein C4513_11775 [Morganella morganii]|nr:hypothetical protein [Morganella morganii]